MPWNFRKNWQKSLDHLNPIRRYVSSSPTFYHGFWRVFKGWTGEGIIKLYWQKNYWHVPSTIDVDVRNGRQMCLPLVSLLSPYYQPSRLESLGPGSWWLVLINPRRESPRAVMVPRCQGVPWGPGVSPKANSLYALAGIYGDGAREPGYIAMV